MRSGKVLIVIGISTLIAITFMAGFIFLQGGSGEITKDNDLLNLGIQLPNWNVTLSNRSEVSLHSFRGRFLVVDLMATWCGACESENSELLALYDGMGDSIWLISLGVDLTETESMIADYKEQRGLPWLHGLDSGGGFSTYFSIQYIPSIIILDDEGYVRWYHEGFWEESSMSATLTALM
jgi:thiol-disulfide isomerase/thioredoxin